MPILSTAAQPCKVGRDEYDRMDIENGNTTLKQRNPAVEILLSIRRTRPCQGRQAAVVPLHDKKRHQELCVRRLCLQRLQACFLRQSDRWQIVALDEQHYRACQFGLTDTLASDEQYGRLYTELTGTIVLLIESNNLPTVKQTEEASPKAL